MARNSIRPLFALCLLTAAIGSAQAATVHTTDFISSPTHFNGFEGAPNMFGGYGPSHTEDGIEVTQANMGPAGIWTTYLTPGDPQGYLGNFQGARSWYPYGGDNGYTVIRMADGSDFAAVSFLVGSGYFGNPNVHIYFELADNGAVVQTGTLTEGYDAHWLGFSGGGFDEVRLRDSLDPISSLDGSANALAVDSIKVAAIPEPGTYALMLGGLVMLAGRGLRRRG